MTTKEDRQGWFLGLGAAAEGLLFLLLRRRPTTGFSASISLAILDMEGNPVPKNSPAQLSTQASYIALFSVTNRSTQGATLIPATFDITLDGLIGSTVLEFGGGTGAFNWPAETLGPGESRNYQSTFSIAGLGGQSGDIGVSVLSPVGTVVAAVSEPVNVTPWLVTWLSQNVPSQMAPGQVVTVQVGVRNPNAFTWIAGGTNLFDLSYHWLLGPNIVVWNGERGFLPYDVPPGGTAVVDLPVIAPSVEGSYTLQIDMVKEFIRWFEQEGNTVLSVPVGVVPIVPSYAATVSPIAIT